MVETKGESIAQSMVGVNQIPSHNHTLLELVDDTYQLIRAHFPTRKTLFDDFRALNSLPLPRLLGSFAFFHAPRFRAS